MLSRLVRWWKRWQADRQHERATEEDKGRREQIERVAFQNNRFVIYIQVYGRTSPVCFTPLEQEAQTFLGNYVVPFMRNELRFLSHSTWEPSLPDFPVRTRSPYTEIFRGHDVRAVTILAPTQEYLNRLDQVMAGLMGAAERAAEASRLAERTTVYSMSVAAMRDAMRPTDDK